MDVSVAKKITFCLTVIGMVVLVGYLLLAKPGIVIAETIDSLSLNEKVVLNGIVTKARHYDSFSVLEIDGISVVCDCQQISKGKNVTVIGLLTEYEGTRQVQALRIFDVIG